VQTKAQILLPLSAGFVTRCWYVEIMVMCDTNHNQALRNNL
jgi:hypothetical protein